MPLGTEVSLGAGDIVLHGDPLTIPLKRVQVPIFGPRLLWPRSDGLGPLGTEAGLGPGHIVIDLDGDPTPPTERGTEATYFSAHVCSEPNGRPSQQLLISRRNRLPKSCYYRPLIGSDIGPTVYRIAPFPMTLSEV